LGADVVGDPRARDVFFSGGRYVAPTMRFALARSALTRFCDEVNIGIS
jgi:hypothetical protein